MDMGRGKERARCMKTVTWKLTLPYVKEIANGNLLCGSGNLNGALYQPRGVGWGGRWEGGPKRREYMYTLWLINVEVRQKTRKFCKAIILQYIIDLKRLLLS